MIWSFVRDAEGKIFYSFSFIPTKSKLLKYHLPLGCSNYTEKLNLRWVYISEVNSKWKEW